MTKYTDQMKAAVHELMALKPYPTLKFAIAEYPNTLTVRVFQSNIDQFTHGQYQSIIEYLVLVRDTIRSFGAKCDIEGVK